MFGLNRLIFLGKAEQGKVQSNCKFIESNNRNWSS